MVSVNWSSVITPSDFLQTANTTSGGWFWTAVLYMVVIVLTMSMIQFGLEIAIMSALFIGIIAGIMLVYMNLMSMTWLGVLIGAELFIIIYNIVTSNKNQ